VTNNASAANIPEIRVQTFCASLLSMVRRYAGIAPTHPLQAADIISRLGQPSYGRAAGPEKASVNQLKLLENWGG